MGSKDAYLLPNPSVFAFFRHFRESRFAFWETGATPRLCAASRYFSGSDPSESREGHPCLKRQDPGRAREVKRAGGGKHGVWQTESARGELGAQRKDALPACCKVFLSGLKQKNGCTGLGLARVGVAFFATARFFSKGFTTPPVPKL
jgi:hypothetical protein